MNGGSGGGGVGNVVVIEFTGTGETRTASIPSEYQGKLLALGYAIESMNGYSFAPSDTNIPYVQVDLTQASINNLPSTYSSRKVWGYFVYTG